MSDGSWIVEPRHNVTFCRTPRTLGCCSFNSLQGTGGAPLGARRFQMTKTFDVDYLIIGAGAAAMAFADELLTNSGARILLVDRRDRPGGHWNDAYPFVRLHQPSAFYGVNSRELGSRTTDAVGFNKGLYNLASGAEVLAYFDQVMQQRLLSSGRVRYFPMCNVTADDQFESLLTGERFSV